MTEVVSPWQQCRELARKDLRVEWRAGETLLVIAPFGALALLAVPLAVGANTPLLRQVGPGMYWVVVLLFGLMVTVRQSAVDGSAQRAMLRLVGVHPLVRLSGRILANVVLVLGFEVVLVPVVAVLYDPDPVGWVWLVPVLPMVAIGLAVLGTAANALSEGLAGRTALGPLLVMPVAVPLLLAASQVPQAVLYGRPPWPWLLLIAAVDLVAAAALALCATQLEEVA